MRTTFSAIMATLLALAVSFTTGCGADDTAPVQVIDQDQVNNNVEAEVAKTLLPSEIPGAMDDSLPRQCAQVSGIAYRFDSYMGKYFLCGARSAGYTCQAIDAYDGACGNYSGSGPVAKSGPAFTSDQLIDVAVGECAPPKGIVCADWLDATLDGEAFDGTILCFPSEPDPGSEVWRTTQQPELCPEGTTCQMDGYGIQRGVCREDPQCVTDADCLEDTQCSDYACVDGTCQETYVVGQCDDGNACTVDDACLMGHCFGSPMDCSDDNPCTMNETCLEGACVADNVEAGMECQDGDLCTENETCDGEGSCVPAIANKCDDGNACNGQELCNVLGACSAGESVNCDDDNECTNDSCNPTDGSCSNTAVANELPCGEEDNMACLDGMCVADWCLVSAGSSCYYDANTAGIKTCIAFDDNSTYGTTLVTPCYEESADEPGAGDPSVWQCSSSPTGPFCKKLDTVCQSDAECADGDPCNGTETCVEGTCTAGTVLDCNDGDLCTADACVSTSGCTHTLKDCGDQVCDQATGACVDCTTDAECADGNLCNGDELCDGGMCVAGTPVSCLATEVCNPEDGACVECLAQADCPVGQQCVNMACTSEEQPCSADSECLPSEFCGIPITHDSGFCHPYTNQHGQIADGESGLGGGTAETGDCSPRQKCADGWDSDGDGYVPGTVAYGSSNPNFSVEMLGMGDCDDTATGAGNNTHVNDYSTDLFDNDCNGSIACQSNAQCMSGGTCVGGACTVVRCTQNFQCLSGTCFTELGICQ